MIIRVLPEAFTDLEEAVDWYDAQREGLGEEFERQFFATVNAISLNPLSTPIVHREFRKKVLNRFLYGIYYRIYEDQIVVTLVFHLMRDPKRLRNLLRSRRPSGQG